MPRMQIIARSGTKPGERNRDQLNVEGVEDRVRVPGIGESIRLISKGPARLTAYVRVENVMNEWGPDGETHTVYTYGDFVDIKRLALVFEWKVLSGIEMLSPDQQSSVRCAQGECDDHAH